MLDQIVEMGELEEEECNFINGIIQKIERFDKKRRNNERYRTMLCQSL